MSQRTSAGSHRTGRWPSLPRPLFAALLMGLALMVAACGSGPQTGPAPTPTPKPTATSTPIPPPSTTWRIVPSPNPAQPPQSVLSSVSALSPSQVWAVGYSYREGDNMSYRTVIEQWNGNVWHIVSSPPADTLSGVAAVSPTDVWAVGGGITYGAGYHPYTPLIEHWNGTQWSVVPGADVGSSHLELEGVAAVATNDVWAVGYLDVITPHLGLYRPLIERWDGTAWHGVSGAPLPDAVESSLSAITRIPGTNQLWAVGHVTYVPATGQTTQILIERWDGTTWRTIAGPTLPGGVINSGLLGVAALSATDAWAVGEYDSSDHKTHTLILHWDGTSWQVVAAPDTWGMLWSVAAAGPRDVRAVGHSFSGDGNVQRALIEQWDGTAWRVVTTPTLSGATYSALSGVTADSAGNFWAVGSYRDAAATSRTLIVRCP